MAIKDKLQTLLGKVTGKDIKGDNVEEVIADAEAKYEGGGTGGSTVVANPTLAGDEAELTGLEVDGTKYKVPSGGNSNNAIMSKIELLKRTNGKKFNFTKFKAFLGNLNVLDYVMTNDNDYGLLSVSNATWGATTYIFVVSVSSSGDYSYNVETFDNSFNYTVAQANPLTIGDILDRLILENDLIVDNTSNDYINYAIDDYFQSAGQNDDLCINYIKIEPSIGMDNVMIEFNWDDFFACFDEVQL